jgi:EAL domain-containing protein (putative c-di-GMP-specific phosphodiesterase class I)
MEASIAVGLHLGLHVVVEGIETEAQREFIRGKGCLVGQGYLLARSMALPALLERLGYAAEPP